MARLAPVVAFNAPVPLQLTQSLATKSATVLAVCWSTMSPSTTVDTVKVFSGVVSAVITMEISLPRVPGYLAVAVRGSTVAVACACPVAPSRYSRTVLGAAVRLVPLKISCKNRFLVLVASYPVYGVMSAPASMVCTVPTGPQLKASAIATVPRSLTVSSNLRELVNRI